MSNQYEPPAQQAPMPPVPQPMQPGPPPPQPPPMHYQQPQKPKKKHGFLKFLGLSFGAIVIIAVVAAVANGGDPATTEAPDEPAVAAPEGAPADEKEEPAPAAKDEGPITLSATPVDFKASVLAEGSDYTSIEVTVTNTGEEVVDVNPLYFSVVGDNGSKHTAELGVDEDQIATMKLSKGQKATGTVTAAGTFEAASVEFSGDLLGGNPVNTDIT